MEEKGRERASGRKREAPTCIKETESACEKGGDAVSVLTSAAAAAAHS